MAKSEGTICISVPHSKFWGGLAPVPLVIYAHADFCRALSFLQVSYILLFFLHRAIALLQWCQ